MAGVAGSNPVAPTTPHHNPLISNFYSLYAHEFVRVACCVPRTRVADAEFNLGQTLRLAVLFHVALEKPAAAARVMKRAARADGLRLRQFRGAVAGQWVERPYL